MPYNDSILAYLHRINDQQHKQYAFANRGDKSWQQWQDDARPALRALIGLSRIVSDAADHQPSIKWDGEAVDCDDYTRRFGHMETEPDVLIPFYLFQPTGDGPHPLAICPHGHDPRGHHTSAGIYETEEQRQRIINDDRDVAVQAVERGYISIAPATRGIGCDGVPDIYDRHSNRDCRSHNMHCIINGRSAMGERVYDMERFIDWALAELPVQGQHLLMLGNSGGGMVTNYAAACDTRIDIGIASCSYNFLQTPHGKLSHCDCNMIPGALRFGEFYDISGLIAPRHFLFVHGRDDSLHDNADVDAATQTAKDIYKACDAEEKLEQAYGPAGHRFYKDIMWDFVSRHR